MRYVSSDRRALTVLSLCSRCNGDSTFSVMSRLPLSSVHGKHSIAAVASHVCCPISNPTALAAATATGHYAPKHGNMKPFSSAAATTMIVPCLRTTTLPEYVKAPFVKYTDGRDLLMLLKHPVCAIQDLQGSMHCVVASVAPASTKHPPVMI